jgi:uncharacterized protein DUF4231
MPADPHTIVVRPIDHLKARIANRLETLNESKARYRRYHSRVALFLILLAACNTTVVTLSQTQKAWPWWGYAAIVLSALIAVLTGVNGLFKPRERHVKNAEALNEVFDIQARLQWRELNEPPISTEEVDKFFAEFRTIEKAFFLELAKLDVKEA